MLAIAGQSVAVVYRWNPFYWIGLAVAYDLDRDGMTPFARELAETMERQQG